ncbi:hypothetical protein [Halegenticoccus tardaugens]|uniref:hypothetical protein n=1 Tax=Halegenticoccus tardaugens TaxID=2071624 RepID=UPI00100AFFED|nr:hypothetical protein [Halegenticoccus tardaugens]
MNETLCVSSTSHEYRIRSTLAVAVAVALGLAPLAVLFSFVLRLAWIAQQTATVAPFAPKNREYRR